jgi:hypothetical protein
MSSDFIAWIVAIALGVAVVGLGWRRKLADTTRNWLPWFGETSEQATVPEAVLSSIAGYYRRVTTTARPMDRLIALVMLVTLAAIIVEIVRGDVSAWVGWTSLVLAAAPITLAAARTLPRAVRLGAREDTVDRQSALARSVGRDHLLCLASIAVLLVLQVAAT